MGCGGSKLEEERAVAHCLVRSQHLADAIRYRYDLADAHASYVSSLRSVGASLHAFLNGLHSPLSHPSPHLQLPAQRKGGNAIAPLSSSSPPPPPPPAIKQQQSHSRSHSDSHIQFHSSDEDSVEDHHLHLHSDDDEPPLGPTYVNLNYARSQPAASSVTYEQRSVGPDAVVSAADPSGTAHPYYGYPYPAQSSNFDPYAAQSSNYYPYQYPYPNYGATGGFFGSSSPPPNIPPPASAPGPGSPSSSQAPPPPPSPPRTSTWDFLNPFEAYDSYYAPAPYSPGRSLKDVREEEGIPDLEDEEPEIVKEAYGDQKVAAFSSGAAANMGEYSSKAAAAKEDGIKSEMDAGSSSLEHDVHVVEKSVAGDEKSEERRNVAARVYHNDSEVVQDIMIQFNTASEAADQVSKMLEVGKLPYQRKDSVYKVSAMMICGFPSTSSAMDEDFLNFEEDKAMGCGNLSSTLQKLLMWEKKLLDEVRAEEKMRILYERKHEHLQHLIDTGAESAKLEATQTFIKKLSTRIRIAIQVVDGISKKISNLRDEELWPELCELVQGLTRMWAIMLECHHTQCQAISEAKNLDSVLSGAKLSDSHVAAAKQLELELWDWIASFSSWIDAQRNYVRSLNDWLNKGIVYEPEVTDDGIIPYSPGRLGAPSIFVICSYWSHSMEMISGSEVVNATQAFATNISHLREQHSFEQRQMLMANKDMDRKLRSMEREEQVMRKALEARNKKVLQATGQSVVPLSGQLVHQAPPVEVSSLQANLRQIFEAMESFTATSAKAYEQLHKQLKEEKERFTRENAEIS